MIARLSIAYLARVAPSRWLRIMGIVAIFPSIGFMYLFVSGTRNKTGAFGEKIWWNPFRPIHSILYGLFAYFAIKGNRRAWIFLLTDALVGLGGFLTHHSFS
jgi:hypothetical protein